MFHERHKVTRVWLTFLWRGVGISVVLFLRENNSSRSVVLLLREIPYTAAAVVAGRVTFCAGRGAFHGPFLGGLGQ